MLPPADPWTADNWTEQAERDRWAAAAASWQASADSGAAMAARMSRPLIAALAPKPGQMILDLSCGVGEPAFTLADQVAPGGLVLGLDPVLPMLRAAVARASGAQQVHFAAADLACLPVPSAVFDAVSCRFGLMFVADLSAVAAEIARVLRPGGRFAALVWGPRADNAGWAALADLAPAIIDDPAVTLALDSPFRLSDPAPLLTALVDAGLSVSLETLRLLRTTTADPANLDDLVEKALGHLLTGHSRARLRTALAGWLAARAAPDGTVELPVCVHLVTGRLPLTTA